MCELLSNCLWSGVPHSQYNTQYNTIHTVHNTVHHAVPKRHSNSEMESGSSVLGVTDISWISASWSPGTWNCPGTCCGSVCLAAAGWTELGGSLMIEVRVGSFQPGALSILSGPRGLLEKGPPQSSASPSTAHTPSPLWGCWVRSLCPASQGCRCEPADWQSELAIGPLRKAINLHCCRDWWRLLSQPYVALVKSVR